MLPPYWGSRRAGMTSRLASGGNRNPDQDKQLPPLTPVAHERDGWRILSYLLGGMILYGGIGWLIGHWTGITILFPVGMILGIGLAIAMIIFRFSRT
jgi:F0F1-type ATP synthase assembly protein I